MISDAIAMRIPHRAGFPDHGGGAGEEKKYYCVEGYSKAYGGNVKLYVSTYNDAVKLCEKLGLGTDCIKEVSGVH